MYRILIVEDDPIISEAVNRFLSKWGYTVETVTDFNNVLEHFTRYMPQLVLMDIGLPFYNGYFWCSEIRKVSQIPIIFISSASDNMNVVMAMNMGGDDFIVKPFDLDVLAAKIQAILRRTYSFQTQTNLMEYQGIILNILDMTLLYKEEKQELSKNEFKILQILFENVGNAVSREKIMKRLWDSDCFIDDNTLTVNMNRLRKRLEGMRIYDLIVTRKGIGYQLGQMQ